MWTRRSSMMLGIENKACANSICADNVCTNTIDLINSMPMGCIEKVAFNNPSAWLKTHNIKLISH